MKHNKKTIPAAPLNEAIPESDIQNKVAAILDIGEKLKTEFYGIDKQIDTIIRYVTPFYATPSLLSKPVVICLWGMTGVGKTDVLRRLAVLMNMQSRFATFDMGEYTGDFTEYALRHQLDDLADSVEDGRAMIVFDEMQTIRFINERNDELDRPAARLIWDILDGAPIARNSSFSNRILGMIKELKRCQQLGVTVEKNQVVNGKQHYKKIRRMWARDENDHGKVINSDDFDCLYQTNPSFFEYNENYEFWEKQFETYVDLEQYIQCLQTISQGYILGEPKSLSRSLIFCVGNLDEVYQGSKAISPDIDIESLREITEKVNLTQVKKALLSRFRPEQIARLGNNHVIYPSLDRNSYWNIIRKHVEHSLNKVKNIYNVQLHVNQNVLELIFNESVFPTQGARPVNNSFSMLFDAYLADALCHLKSEGDVYWNYDSNTKQYHFTRGQEVYEQKVQLMIESQRDSLYDDKQAVIAVHEAGHGLAYALYCGAWPLELRSRTADSEGGFTAYEVKEFKTRHDVLSELKIDLAGIVAEEIIFGAENVSNGSSSDIEHATDSLQEAISDLGLFRELWIGTVSQGAGKLSDGYSLVERNTFVKDILQNTHTELLNEMSQHKTLIVHLANYLVEHTRMSRDVFEQICNQYGVDIQPGFSHREHLLQMIEETNSVH